MVGRRWILELGWRLDLWRGGERVGGRRGRNGIGILKKKKEEEEEGNSGRNFNPILVFILSGFPHPFSFMLISL